MRISFLCIFLSLLVVRTSYASDTYTALVEFDACLPLASGETLAGSSGGLVLVNSEGKQSELLTALDGLPGTQVHSIAQSSEGIWVGTDQGLALVNRRDNALVVERSYPSKPVRDILVHDEDVFLATWGQGVMQVEGSKLKSVHLGDAPRKRRITALARHQGRLWWASAGAGLWSSSQAGATQVRSISAGAVLWSLRSHAGSLWIGGERGVRRLGSKRRSMASVRGLALLDGNVATATFGAGMRLAANGQTVGPPDRFSRSLQSAHGHACMGSQDALWLKKQGSWQKAALVSRLPANDIAAFTSDGTRSFIGSFDQGLATLEDGQFRKLPIKVDPHINALAIDKKDGALWIGTSSSLYKWKQGGPLLSFDKSSGLPSRHILSLFALPKGGVLVGTARGAATVRAEVVAQLGGKNAPATGNVWAVAQTSDGTQWLGTTRGVYRFRRGKVTRFRQSSGELPDDWVMALAVADDGVFVGTYKAGVVRLVEEADGKVRATQLGTGWVNPSGLHWDGSLLRAATIQGPLVGDGLSAIWRKGPKTPSLDTTVFIPTATGQWLATRSGLVRVASAP